MESFPICNSTNGQRPLVCITDDEMKASELALRANRVPVICRELLNFVHEGADNDLVALRFAERIKANPFRDQVVLIFGNSPRDASLALQQIVMGASVFYTMQFGLESFHNGVRDKLDAVRLESGIDLGSYRYCHCSDLVFNVPLLNYSPYAVDADGELVSLGVHAVNHELHLHRSLAFGHHRFALWDSTDETQMRLELPASTFFSWSDHGVDTAIELLFVMAFDYYEIWKIQIPEFRFDGR